MKEPWMRLAILLLTITATAQAHFLFIVPEPGGATVRIFISEELKPEGKVGLELVGGAKLSLRDAAGRETALSLTREDNAYIASLGGSGTRLVHGIVDLGFSQSGPTVKPYLLIYHPKTILGNALDAATIVGGQTPVELIPAGTPGAIRLQLLTRGKPLPDAEITVIQPDGSQRKVKTDASGQTEPLTGSGRFGAWARYWEPASGERDGKKYEEVRHYATLVFDAPGRASAPSSGAARSATAAARFTAMPQAVSSFGAVVSDGWLYVYGGHVSPTHTYSTEAVSGQFQRLNLAAPGAWEQLPGGPHLQGTNLAAYAGKIYRIGGMQPRNPPGQPADTVSVADAARFDPAVMRWEALPALPEPRSSHDFVVVGSKLIVSGGWDLQGKAGQKWMDTLQVMDLAKTPLTWKSAAQPFKRRALIAAAHNGKMYVMGGMTDTNAVVTDVDIYDPQSGAWTKGPALPGKALNSFAPAAAVHEGKLYVSLGDGSLYGLNEAAQRWEEAGSATPRVAHRLVSGGNSLLVMGGAAGGKNFDLIEVLDR